jgi:hypothetical protein
MNKTLSTSTKHLGHTLNWDRARHPAPGTGRLSDYQRLLAALDEGWQIIETADFLAHGVNAEGRGYLLTLMHPRRFLTRELDVVRSPEITALLALEGVPGFKN